MSICLAVAVLFFGWQYFRVRVYRTVPSGGTSNAPLAHIPPMSTDQTNQPTTSSGQTARFSKTISTATQTAKKLLSGEKKIKEEVTDV